MNGNDKPRERPPAGSKLREYYGRASEAVKREAQKRLFTRRAGPRRGGIR